MHKLRLTLAALLAGGGLLAIPAAAHADSTVCTLTLNSVTAQDLQEEAGGDEIRIKLGDTIYPVSGSVFFSPASVHHPRSASAFGSPVESFVSSIDIVLFEADPVFRDTIEDSGDTCRLGQHTQTMSGSGAIYDVTYTITQ